MDLYGTRELTRHQWRIVRLLAKGMKNPEIARALGTTDNMIKNYLRIIFDKTGMNSRLELALWYVKQQHTEVQSGRTNAGVAVRAAVPHAVGSGAQASAPASAEDRVRGAKGRGSQQA